MFILDRDPLAFGEYLDTLLPCLQEVFPRLHAASDGVPCVAGCERRGGGLFGVARRGLSARPVWGQKKRRSHHFMRDLTFLFEADEEHPVVCVSVSHRRTRRDASSIFERQKPCWIRRRCQLGIFTRARQRPTTVDRLEEFR